jgi:catechol 2,3-dioxygenase-like lactoylglutathione lyase family enzyme
VKIQLSSLLVRDQQKALTFYTETLGFVMKTDIPMGEHRWLTVVSAEAPGGVELVLEPNQNPAAKTYQEALFEQGIPLTAFEVVDVSAEYLRLKSLGVSFRGEPADAGGVTLAILDDTCGNWIQLYQLPESEG